MHFDFSGTQELYLEIAEKYKNYIENGILRNGEKLPSVRQAALELGVNPNTVARSYSLLEKDGYIKSFPKKGVYVNYDGAGRAPSIPKLGLKDDIRKLLASGISKEDLITQIEEVCREIANEADDK